MANYLVVKNNNSTKSYECKSTHTAVPFVKVNSSYLDLTTETTAGLQYKVKIGNTTYRPKQTYTTISSRSSEYTETTGYSGISSKTTSYINNSSNLTTITKNYTSATCTGFVYQGTAYLQGVTTGVLTNFRILNITPGNLTRYIIFIYNYI